MLRAAGSSSLRIRSRRFPPSPPGAALAAKHKSTPLQRCCPPGGCRRPACSVPAGAQARGLLEAAPRPRPGSVPWLLAGPVCACSREGSCGAGPELGIPPPHLPNTGPGRRPPELSLEQAGEAQPAPRCQLPARLCPALSSCRLTPPATRSPARWQSLDPSLGGGGLLTRLDRSLHSLTRVIWELFIYSLIFNF